jgi:hypothetical protein
MQKNMQIRYSSAYQCLGVKYWLLSNRLGMCVEMRLREVLHLGDLVCARRKTLWPLTSGDVALDLPHKSLLATI